MEIKKQCEIKDILSFTEAHKLWFYCMSHINFFETIRFSRLERSDLCSRYVYLNLSGHR